jgi:hypothetical protein
MNLAARLRRHPHLAERIDAILRVAELDGEGLRTADEAETVLIEETRKLGLATLAEWGERAEAASAAEYKREQPVSHGVKKKTCGGGRPSGKFASSNAFGRALVAATKDGSPRPSECPPGAPPGGSSGC